MRRDSHAPLPRFSLPTLEREKADSTEEVELHDILLEAYLDDAPPVSRVTRTVPPVSEPDPVDLLLASAPAPTPTRARTSLRPPAPPPPPPSARVSVRPPIPTPTPWAELPALVAESFAHAASTESPSVAPVVVASSASSAPPAVWPSAWAASGSAFPAPGSLAPAPKSAVVPPPPPSRLARAGRAMATLVWSLVLLVVGAAVGAILVLRVYPSASSVRALDAARSRLREVTRAPEPPAHAAAAPKPETPSASVAPAPAPVASSASSSIPVAALPAPAIPAGQGRVTLPAYARGHRVFLDGAALPVSEGDVLVRCGRHAFRVGSTGKPHDVDVPCGAALVLR